MTKLSQDQIDAALEAGIITAAQAKSMRSGPSNPIPEHLPKNVNASVIGNEDDMRFVRSFSDVFIAIGIGLFALGLSAMAALLGGGVSFLGAAAIMAVLAEYFGKRKRQHLPTLITALAFLLFTQRGLGVVLDDIGFGGPITTALITLLAMCVFYLRVRLPFCMALIAIAILYLFFAVLNGFAPDIMRAHTGWALLAGGLATLLAALRYDMKDKHRTTRFADNAFWLHFTAAPLIIHGLALEMVRVNTETLFNVVPVPTLDKGDALLLMVMVIIVALFGLAINRRALLVSSLGYAGFAIGFLMSDTGLGFGNVAALTLLLLGASIIFLGAGWHTARGGLLKVLPSLPIFPPRYDPDFKP